MVTDRLFVYGSLAPGRANEHVLSGIPGTWVPGTVRGTLFWTGWGAHLGCPGIVLAENGDEVDGYVLTATSLAEHWSRLDELEGHEYVRTRTRVACGEGDSLECDIYVLRHGLLALPVGR
jgi:gamma-glutamylcyclotransferase (GGCT)/AIG2-like uncharacterized protein YtfP